VEAHEPQLLADVLPIFPPKTDISFSIFLDLHFGQFNSSASRWEKQRCSKWWRHFLQRNS